MFRLFHVHKDEVTDCGLWMTVDKAIEEGMYRLDRGINPYPDMGWMVKEQGECPRIYFFDSTFQKELPGLETSLG